MKPEGMRAIRPVVLAAALTGLAGSALGADMICKNPGREYYLVYNPGDGYVMINPDSDRVKWPLLSNMHDDRQEVLIVGLGAPGATAQVHFRPYMKVDIFHDGQLSQTDGCRPAGGN